MLELRDKLSSRGITDKEIQEYRNELIEIESKSKQLNECSLEECEDLKTQLFSKYNAAMGIGRTDISRQFQIMLSQVDSRIQALNIDTARAESEKRKELANKDKAIERGQGKISSKSGRNRWSINLDGLD